MALTNTPNDAPPAYPDQEITPLPPPYVPALEYTSFPVLPSSPELRDQPSSMESLPPAYIPSSQSYDSFSDHSDLESGLSAADVLSTPTAAARFYVPRRRQALASAPPSSPESPSSSDTITTPRIRFRRCGGLLGLLLLVFAAYLICAAPMFRLWPYGSKVPLS
ncbi:hypothetical protein BU16DRAFT_613388 [Lophium mytilinum]|uniref:Transmembrane protein n=1 Tax=Lophium mytilinum TaxID=390894 RepID=A0A6A6RAR8_9PEZI|nr:hypothetical protein BU16DRAFT_613388 [Lophium mytilinum]